MSMIFAIVGILVVNVIILLVETSDNGAISSSPVAE